LENVVAQRHALLDIVVVDSSTDDDTNHVVSQFRQFGVAYIRSKPGLPRQRNAGISHLALHSADSEIYSFLDDDVEIPDGYFENVWNEFKSLPEAASISGFDLGLSEPRQTIFHRMFGLRARNDTGRILKSGVAIPVYHPVGKVRVDWAPGHSLNVRKSTFEIANFDSSIRMYGEDVDFCLRANQAGELFIAESLGIWHRPERLGRESALDSEAYNAGFRYQLSKKWPCKVSTGWVLWSTLVLAVGYFLFGITKIDGIRIRKSLGLGKFFCRLFLRQQVTQSHAL
jgi:GT2 family glycosyltransferase